jgi:hypothetical protein
MPINFPDSPNVSDLFTIGSKTWIWDGSVWNTVTTAIGAQGPTGPQGDFVTGPTGPTGPQGIMGISVDELFTINQASVLIQNQKIFSNFRRESQ